MKPIVLMVTLLSVPLISGCLNVHVPIRYTSMTLSKRLADYNQREFVELQRFQDGRLITNNSKGSGAGGVVTVNYDLEGDAPSIVREAFGDGLLKSGFLVDLDGPSTTNTLFTVSGKVLELAINSKAGWSQISVLAGVQVEITLKAEGCTSQQFLVVGTNTLQRGDSITFETDLPNGLDSAIRDCVKHFLQDERFLSFLQNARARQRDRLTRGLSEHPTSMCSLSFEARAGATSSSVVDERD